MQEQGGDSTADRDAIWRALIDSARHEDQLLATVRDFLASIPREDLKAVAEGADFWHIVDAEELGRCAYMLVATHCASVDKADDGGVLFRLATFFAYAHSRLASMSSAAARQRAYSAMKPMDE